MSLSEQFWLGIEQTSSGRNRELCIIIQKKRKHERKKQNSYLYLLSVCGILSAFGPFITDFYLPALPALHTYFQTTTSLVQLSLTCSMIGLAVGQLIIGPFGDKYGRKMPLLLSLIVFCLSTLGCLYASNIYGFIFFRLIQGMAGAGGVVLARSIAIDLYEGKPLARFYSLLSMVTGIAPVCAPVLGGFLLEITDWKGIFSILLVIGILLIFTLLSFRESLPKEKRQTQGITTVFLNYRPILHHDRFMNYILIQAFAMGAMFAYIAASPFIFQAHYGLSPITYSLYFGANAFSIMLGNLSASLFRQPVQALQTGTVGLGIMGIVVTMVLALDVSALATECTLFFFLFFLGLILPSSTILALDLERKNSGNASALLGFLTFLFGGMVSPLTGLGNMLYSMGSIIVVCCIGAWVCTRHTLRKIKKQKPQASTSNPS